ncbi:MULTISPECIES: hypothetical protein [unclassified Methylobacterium]|uniref:hypothetical protein n=1 Tax=unclassified Methylobacterium TaxID=2615210 RepID=UPI0011C1DC33|nr:MULTISPECIES: hypothetical protein [unclassified Methylobacterium]QEE39326.1 hypothetical protein FVA80_10625 [Methylobacterium sp. WL1]TXN58286.1 hypothetical protein FV241_07945 [Methylobacterium sp. WL2]
MPVRSRLILVVLVCAPVSALAGEFAPTAPAQGMMMPPPDPGMANSVPSQAPPADAGAPAPVQPATADPAAGRRRFQVLGSGFPATDGKLPNQRTGPRRAHVVHDICIGC